MLKRFAHEDGQTMAEYGVVLGIITLLVVTAIAALSGSVQSVIEGTASLLAGLG